MAPKNASNFQGVLVNGRKDLSKKILNLNKT